MISLLRGTVGEFSLDTMSFMCGPVGYEVHISRGTQEILRENPKSEYLIYVSTIVREDAFLLFGFLSSEEKNFFLSLLKVNGVGPKMAMNILSGGTLTHLYRMIESEDVKGLSSLPKVGKKTAEQIILTLKGKLVIERDTRTLTSNQARPQGVKSDIGSALINLGFRGVDVDSAIQHLPEGVSIEEGVRLCLTKLSL